MERLFENLKTSVSSLNNYGSLESVIRGIRENRPLDLCAENWHNTNPDKDFSEWQKEAREVVSAGLHYDPGKLDLQTEIHEKINRDGYIQEKISFNTTPWIRVNGYFLYPDKITDPVPGLVVFHAWGGIMLFGKERIVNTGRDHLLLQEHRDKIYSGNYLAEVYARAGYAVVVIDAHHFGERAPRGTMGIPEEYDPYELESSSVMEIHKMTSDALCYGVRQLNWAGTTWMGVNFWDDSRCIDFLQSRPEVDHEKIGCTGVSGGGWRTNFLAALDPRVKASSSVCWMTICDYQQMHNVKGAIGTFCLLPGVWDRLDIPDLQIMSYPCASLVLNGREDKMFPPEANAEAEKRIREGYEWAGDKSLFKNVYADKPHVYDQEFQDITVDWFDQHLK